MVDWRQFSAVATGRGVMTTHDRIELNRKVMLGKPVIRGTRIPVELIVRKLSEGADEKTLLDAYPRLTQADILAALTPMILAALSTPKIMATRKSDLTSPFAPRKLSCRACRQ
jgi:uncharacterized protein (DUF433 family)